jgi:hypothetical protein
LSEKRRLEKEIEIDFVKIARIGNKVNELLARKAKSSAEAYAALRFLCILYEQKTGISFQPEFEEELRKMVKRSLESRSGSSTAS